MSAKTGKPEPSALLPLGKRLLLLICVYAAGSMLVQSRTLFSPHQGKRLLTRSLDALQGRNPHAALRHLRALLARDPGNHIYLSLQGDAYRQLEDWPAQARAGELLLKSARPRSACDHLTHAYAKLGLDDKLLAAYEICMRIDPDNPFGTREFARFLKRRGDHERARALLESLGGPPQKRGSAQ